MTLELVQSPIALGSKVMGGVVLTEGREGISLAQEQSSHHSIYDPELAVNARSMVQDHSPQKTITFLKFSPNSNFQQL